MPGAPPHLGGPDQRLAGDTAPVSAGTAERTGVGQRDPFTCVTSGDGGGEPGRAATQDHQVEVDLTIPAAGPDGNRYGRAVLADDRILRVGHHRDPSPLIETGL